MCARRGFFFLEKQQINKFHFEKSRCGAAGAFFPGDFVKKQPTNDLFYFLPSLCVAAGAFFQGNFVKKQPKNEFKAMSVRERFFIDLFLLFQETGGGGA